MPSSASPRPAASSGSRSGTTLAPGSACPMRRQCLASPRSSAAAASRPERGRVPGFCPGYCAGLWPTEKTGTAMHSSLGSFGDACLDNRGGVILEQMLTSKTVCYRRFDETRKSGLGAWRFFANEKVTGEKIIDNWGERTRDAVAGRHVLAIQDTTEVHFATPERRRGLGQCGHGNVHGLLAHTMMALDADSVACLGLVSGQIWNRETIQTTPLRQRALAERESRR